MKRNISIGKTHPTIRKCQKMINDIILVVIGCVIFFSKLFILYLTEILMKSRSMDQSLNLFFINLISFTLIVQFKLFCLNFSPAIQKGLLSSQTKKYIFLT